MTDTRTRDHDEAWAMAHWMNRLFDEVWALVRRPA